MRVAGGSRAIFFNAIHDSALPLRYLINCLRSCCFVQDGDKDEGGEGMICAGWL